MARKFAQFFKFTISFYILTGIKVIMLACLVLYWLVLGSMAKTMSTVKSTICCTYKTTLEGCMKNMLLNFKFLSSCGDCLVFFLQFLIRGMDLSLELTWKPKHLYGQLKILLNFDLGLELDTLIRSWRTYREKSVHDGLQFATKFIYDYE